MMQTAQKKQGKPNGQRHGIRFRDGGLVLFEPAMEPLPRWTLRCLLGIPRAARERVLFGRSAASHAARLAVQKILNGPKQAHIQFAEGPAAGYSLKCYTSEKYFLMGADYEREMREMLERLCRPGMVAYQVGAHCGYWAILLSRICGRHGRVFAFEASPANFERLVGNLRLNLTPNVTPVNREVSDLRGAVLPEAENADGAGRNGSHEKGGREGGKQGRVERVRLDDFVFAEEHTPPGLLLMNVGGAGGKALRGARETLRQGTPLILCEIHDPKEQYEVEGEVSALGYAVRTISNARNYPRPVLCEARKQKKAGPAEDAVFALPPAIVRRRYLQHSFQGV